MLDPTFLEVMNGVLFMVSIYVVAVFAAHLWRHRWQGYCAENQAAIAILIVFAGESIIRGWVWFWRHQINAGNPTEWMQNYPVLVIGVAMAIVGSLCVARNFSPPSGHGWIVAGVVAIGIAALVAL
jgi:hypothetical protein